MTSVKYNRYKVPPPIENYRTDPERSFLVPVILGSLISAVIWLGLFVLFF